MDENPIKEFVLFVARSCERAVTVMRAHGFRFERFPRDLATQPPVSDAERWECLAFSLYADLSELASKADRLLEDGTAEAQAQHIASLQIRLSEEREICEWVRAELRGTRQRLSALADWRPIETAPTDGTRILVYVRQDDRDIRLIARADDASDGWYTDPGDHRIGPTHWIPLPESPHAERLAHPVVSPRTET